MATTVKAMKRVQEIRAKREHTFYKNRMSGNRERERDENVRLIRTNIELLGAASEKNKSQAVKVQAQEAKRMEVDE